ncbi:hypothetical protein EVAR_54810_1 [Eumeta japonica]|uniref:Uncharacterized protein n=1 Tax=Eumeta variegata TaxID=151549 RepID=A0A4C1XZE2_EUMVA|nr:hypothetical protein EVAR_54810_1 [Eumeta japonica]
MEVYTNPTTAVGYVRTGLHPTVREKTKGVDLGFPSHSPSCDRRLRDAPVNEIYYSTPWRTVGKSKRDALASQNAKDSKPANSSQTSKAIKVKAPTTEVIASPTPKKTQKTTTFIHSR